MLSPVKIGEAGGLIITQEHCRLYIDPEDVESFISKAVDALEQWKLEKRIKTVPINKLENHYPHPNRRVFSADHVVDKFEIKIRSLSSLSQKRLKDLIETKYEVVSIEHIDRHVMTREHRN